MKFGDFFRDPNGEVSEKKLWAQIAKAVVTGVYAYQGFTSTISEGLAMFTLAYLGCVGGIELASKYLSMRPGIVPQSTTTVEKTISQTKTVTAPQPEVASPVPTVESTTSRTRTVTAPGPDPAPPEPVLRPK